MARPAIILAQLLPALLAAAPLLGLGPLDPPAGSVAPTGPTRILQIPFTISAAGSYLVARDLVEPVSSSAAITINADDVTLDLGGFRVAKADASTELRDGIRIINGRNRITVRNGTVSGWTGGGVIGIGVADVHLDHLNVTGCLDIAVQTGNRARLTGCTITSNGKTNADIGARSIVRGCTFADALDGHGLFIGDSSVLTGSVWAGNVGTTIARQQLLTQGSCIVSGCTVKAEAGAGVTAAIQTGGVSIIRDCAISALAPSAVALSLGGGSLVADCELTTTGASSVGITSSSDLTVRDCQLVGLSGATGAVGIRAFTRAFLTGNTITDYATGISVQPGNPAVVVRDCHLTGSSTASGIGIAVAGPFALLLQNSFSNLNLGVQIASSAPRSRVDSNHFLGLSLGIDTLPASVGNLVVRNRFTSVANSYTLDLDNPAGPFVLGDNAEDISVIAASSHPLANVQH